MLLVPSDVSNFLPLKYWMFAHLLVGVVSFSYITFLYELFGPRYRYKVTGIYKSGDVVNIFLSPEGRKISFSSGQFIYISADAKSPGRELHPFTISSAPEEEILRISSKIVGDYTLKLPNINEGSEMTLYGPYGKFSEKFFREREKETVWIAGGIGVTPFLSLIRNSEVRLEDRKVCFYYCFKKDEEAVFEKEISYLTGISKSIKFIPWDTAKNRHLNADMVCQNLSNPTDSLIQICGPQRMMDDFKMQFMEKGIKEENIVFESFQLI
jgi:predicted ferric reductase